MRAHKGDSSMPANRPKSTKRLDPSGDALDLVILLRGITSDGQISAEEVSWLQSWASTTNDTDSEAIKKLRAVVLDIVRDGVVTENEKDFLFTTIRSVLPAEDSAIAGFRRKEQKAAEREKIRAEKIQADLSQKTQDLARREELARRDSVNEPALILDVPVMGVRYEGRESIVRTRMAVGQFVYLRRDIGNKFSSHAVAVLLGDGSQIGYLPDEDAEDVAQLLDDNSRYRAMVRKLHIAKDGVMVPLLIAEFYSRDASVEHSVLPSEGYSRDPAYSIRRSTTAERQDKAGCLSMILVAAGIPSCLGLLRLV